MTGLLRALGRLGDRLMRGRPVDMGARLAPYADPFHLDSRAGAGTPAGPGAGPHTSP